LDCYILNRITFSFPSSAIRVGIWEYACSTQIVHISKLKLLHQHRHKIRRLHIKDCLFRSQPLTDTFYNSAMGFQIKLD